jgi:phage head maturation protease
VDGKTIVRRRILDADLFDVSPVTFPAFTDTDVSVRSNIERAYAEYQKEKEKSEQDERAKAENEILIKHSLLLKELEIMDREV